VVIFLLLACHPEEKVPSQRDYPVLEDVRGVVEGFYGDVWSFDERSELVSFAVDAGLDTWMYAPKADSLHREDWRDRYPQAHLDHFGALAAEIRFVYAIAPGLDYAVDSDDADVLDDKLARIYDSGVRDFCVLFDDVLGPVDVAEPAVQVEIVNRVRSELPEDASLCFISNAYVGTAAEIEAGETSFDPLLDVKSDKLYAAYAEIDASVAILWTGPHVFSRQIGDAAAFRSLVDRPAILWDNYPVNDGALVDELFLAAVPERPELDELDGILINPMTQPQASRIAMWTLGTGGTVEDALEEIDPSGGVMGLVHHFSSHPFLDDGPESQRFLEAQGAGDAALRAEFAGYAAHDLSGVDPRLAAELGEASEKLKLYGEAGLLALDGDPGARALFEQAREIRWNVGENVGGFAASLISDGNANDRDAFGEFFESVLP